MSRKPRLNKGLDGARSGKRPRRCSRAAHQKRCPLAERTGSRIGVFVAILLGLTRLGRAEDFSATLELSGAGGTQKTESAAGLGRHREKARPVFHAAVSEALTLRWKCSSQAAKLFENVLVHVYVAREEKLDQDDPPDLKPDRVALESAITMDFKAGDSAHASLTFRVDKPGIYLVRVEAQGVAESLPLEPFAALDMEVK